MSTDRLRLFVAVRIPEDRLEHLDALVEPLRAKLTNARWTDPANQHLTLKFLGATPLDRLDAVTRTMTMVAMGYQPARVAFSELGAFPSRGRIRVLWMGVADDEGLLAKVAEDLDRSFEPIGIPSEGRAYTPHLTLARFKLPVPLKSGFPSIDAGDIPPFDVDGLTLFRSHLSPKGARYEVIETIPLGSPR